MDYEMANDNHGNGGNGSLFLLIIGAGISGSVMTLLLQLAYSYL